MVFNLFALGHIVIHIVKTRKVSTINNIKLTMWMCYWIIDDSLQNEYSDVCSLTERLQDW